MAINIPGVPFKLTPEDMGVTNFAQAFGQGQSVISNMIAAHLNNLAAQKAQAELPYASQAEQARIALQQAQGKYAGSEADKINYTLAHPGLLGGDDSKNIQAIADMQKNGLLNGLGGQQSVATGGQPQQNPASPQQSPLAALLGGGFSPAPNNPQAQQLAQLINAQQNGGMQPGSQAPQPQQQGQANQQLNPIQQYVQSILQKQGADNAQKVAMANYYNSGGMGRGVTMQSLRAMQGEVQRLNPTFTDEQNALAQDAYSQGLTALPDGTPLAPASYKLNTLLGSTYKSTTDAAQRNQERYANTLQTTFDQGDKVVDGAFKFAGLAGKVKGGIAALAAQRGANDPDYLKYKTFTEQVLPAIATEILRTGGASSTDQQKLLAIKQANPISYNANPQIAMQQWNFLKDLYKSIGKTVAMTPVQTHAALSRSTGGDSGNSGNTMTYNPVTGKLE